MRNHIVFSFILCFVLIFTSTVPVSAQWRVEGTPICTATNTQQESQIAPDGAGGAIIAWSDFRNGVYSDIYVQKIDAGGNIQWMVEGVPLCTATSHQELPQIVSDGAGGAIITWQDLRSGWYDIYAGAINSNGVIQYIQPICQSIYDQLWPQIVSDGSGGAIITWEDYRNGSNFDIYAQSISAAGIVQWAANGVAICTATDDQGQPQITTDGAGGAIITWSDFRSGIDPDIYAEWIDAAGNLWWGTPDGVPVCTGVNHQSDPKIISDGVFGAIITWMDYRSGSYSDIYAQRINGASGAPMWLFQGEAICTAIGDQYVPDIVSDGYSGAIIAWEDYRSGSEYDIYSQRIDANGTVLWTVDGEAICTAAYDQIMPDITTDGLGGAVITWEDQRTYGVYTQRIDAVGNIRWTTNGNALCNVPNTGREPHITSDAFGGAIVAWNTSDDIFAQWGYPLPSIEEVADVPRDQGGNVTVKWNSCGMDESPKQVVSYYSVWRSIPATQATALLKGGSHQMYEKSAGLDPEKPVLRKHPLGATTYWWELVDKKDAHYLDTYSFTSPTLYDSTDAGKGYHYFFVSSHSSNQYIFWNSAPDSGYSVDNLAPGAPEGLAGEQKHLPEGLEITWDPNTEEDLSNYKVYRGADEGFVPGESNLIASPTDTVIFDGDWRWDNTYYYKVSAIDIHGNESLFSLLRPDDITGDDTPDIPLATYLSQNFPNPFNPLTTVRFGLSKPEHVKLCIYNVSGGLVCVLADRAFEAGKHKEVWNGRDNAGRDVSSGVYFYRLSTRTFEKTRKMILLR